MDFDDLLRGDRHRRHDKHGHDHRDHDEHDHHDHRGDEHRWRYGDGEERNDHHGRRWHSRIEHGHHRTGRFDFEHLVHRVLANEKLLIAAAFIIIGVVILAAIFLLPLLGQALDYLGTSGVKGVIERIWQGTGGK